MKTVAELFRRLEAGGFTYAVLRNYENLPDLALPGRESHTDIDLVVSSADGERFRELLISLARDMDWHALSECDHFSQSRARHHNIEIFRFYRIAPLEFLQIDVFHGYLNWGLPLMDEAELLEGRCYDAERGLTHIDPAKETTYRLSQLYGLRHSKRTAEKVSRYRRKVLETCSRLGSDLTTVVEQRFGRFGRAALEALERHDTAGFVRAMHCAKAWFTLTFALRHPLRSAGFVMRRVFENQARFRTRQCGAVVKVHAETAEARQRFTAVMDTLTKLNAFDRWSERSSRWGTFTVRERNIMEQGGLVIEWSGRSSAGVTIGRGDCPDSIAAKIIACALNRHMLLHSLPALVEMEAGR